MKYVSFLMFHLLNTKRSCEVNFEFYCGLVLNEKNHKYNKSPRCYPILFNDIGRNTTETIAAINSISTIRV